MNTADYIIKKLEELGVNEFFGVSSDYNINIINSVIKNQQTNWITCTNELNAGYAADGYARIRGYGALITTYGTGELSAINAIAGCNAENVPVVHIVGIPASKLVENKELVHSNFQDVNYNAFIDSYKTVAADAVLLNRDNAKIEIDRVFKILIKEKRPIYIAIPADISEMEISDRYVSADWISNQENLAIVGDKIVEKINNSKTPVIIGDILIKRFDAEVEYKEFVSKSGIPVTNLLMGTNIVNMDNENFLGGYFGEYRNPIAEKFVKDSDCIISIGTIYSDFNSFGKNLTKDINNNIEIYGTYTCVDGTKYNDIKMADVLEYISGKIEHRNIETEKPNIGYKPQNVNKETLTTDYIYSRLQDFFKDNDIIVAETGSVPYGISLIKFPNNVNIQTQMLWCSKGWATPAAFGVCAAKPQSRVILITGEFAHTMTAIEIGNYMKYGMKPIVIVINNSEPPEKAPSAQDLNNVCNKTVSMNYTKFARTFNGEIWATKVNTDEDFDKALKVTQIMNKMCYIEACVDKSDIPKLLKDIKTINNEQTPAQKEVTTISENKPSEELLTQEKSEFEYETIVHQSLNNNMFGDN